MRAQADGPGEALCLIVYHKLPSLHVVKQPCRNLLPAFTLQLSRFFRASQQLYAARNPEGHFDPVLWTGSTRHALAELLGKGDNDALRPANVS